MVSISTDRTAQRYLRRLRAALGDVPEAARESILQDIRDHIDDALAEGRDTAQILDALGQPRAVAEASRTELGMPASPGGYGSGNALWAVTVALGVVAAVVISFFLRNPDGQHPESGTTPEGALSSLIEIYGPGVALLALLPAAAVVGVVFVPWAARRWVMLALSVLLSVLVFVNPFNAGLFLVPMTLTAWMSATLPHARMVQAGRAESLTIRILGSLLLVAPVVLVLAGLVVGGIGVEQIPLFLWAAFSLTLAVGYAMNVRVAYWISTAYGVFVLGVAVVDAGILVAALWVGGGLILALGLYGLLRLDAPGGGVPRGALSS